jgi:hypothetical protein
VTPFRPAGSTGVRSEGISAQLRGAGAIGSRYYGTNIGPLFEADNMLPASLLHRYLTNAPGIERFPVVTLSPAGSAVFWLTVTTDGIAPGLYQARVSTGRGPGLLLDVTVPDVTLPHPRVYLHTWSATTGMFPFVHSDRRDREIAYKQSLGVTVWNGFPTEDTEAAAARVTGKGTMIYDVWGIGDYGHKLYGGAIDPAKLTAEDEKAIADMIHGHVEQATTLGLSYGDWYAQLTDEPGRGNSAAFGALARLIRKADPKVRIYCNPSFWEGSGCAPDDPVFDSLSSWYNEVVDISVPIFLLLDDRPKSFTLFNHPREFNAYYNVSTQAAKSERAEQCEYYRRQAWDAFRRGWNGWGFYSYFAPRGNPWNDFDTDWYSGEDLPDYEMVYPGPRGPIATRQSEAVREGWEDYCLLTLLREQGKQKLLTEILAAYTANTATPAALRERALQAAAQ